MTITLCIHISHTTQFLCLAQVLNTHLQSLRSVTWSAIHRRLYIGCIHSILSVFPLALWCSDRLKVTHWWLDWRCFMSEWSSVSWDWADCLAWLIGVGDCRELQLSRAVQNLCDLSFILETPWWIQRGTTSVFYTLYVQGRSVYLGRVCATEHVCAYLLACASVTWSTAQTHSQSSTGNHISA